MCSPPESTPALSGLHLGVGACSCVPVRLYVRSTHARPVYASLLGDHTDKGQPVSHSAPGKVRHAIMPCRVCIPDRLVSPNTALMHTRRHARLQASERVCWVVLAVSKWWHSGSGVMESDSFQPNATETVTTALLSFERRPRREREPAWVFVAHHWPVTNPSSSIHLWARWCTATLLLTTLLVVHQADIRIDGYRRPSASASVIYPFFRD